MLSTIFIEFNFRLLNLLQVIQTEITKLVFCQITHLLLPLDSNLGSIKYGTNTRKYHKKVVVNYKDFVIMYE